jgi:hypothetical protein
MGKKVSLDWLDAWIENDLTQEEIDNLSNPQTVCTLVGYVVYDDGTTIALAAERVVGREGDVSWRAVTFVPKCLISAGPTVIDNA